MRFAYILIKSEHCQPEEASHVSSVSLLMRLSLARQPLLSPTLIEGCNVTLSDLFHCH